MGIPQAFVTGLRRDLAGRQLQPRIVGYRNNMGYQLSNGSDTSATSRVRFAIPHACHSLQFIYGNFYGPAGGLEVRTTANMSTVDVKGTVEDTSAITGDSSGTAANIIPMTFGGRLTVSIPLGGIAISDPVALPLIPDDWAVFVRSHVDVSAYAAGAKWCANIATSTSATARFDGSGNNEGYEAGVDESASGGLTVAGAHALAPIGVVGIPVDASQPAIAILGDSIAFGQGYVSLSNHSWAVRACINAELPYINLSIPGQLLSNLILPIRGWMRKQLLPYVTHVLDATTINDVAAGRTYNQIAADKATLWTELQRKGLKVVAVTCLPHVHAAASNPDGYRTAATQAVKDSSQNAVRVALNTALRDGTLSHAALVRVIDPCTVVEANSSNVLELNGGLYYGPNPAGAVTGTASAGASLSLTDSSKTWTTNQFQYGTVKITGGTGSGQIVQVSSNNGTVLTMASAYSPVPDATSEYNVGAAYTTDGLHHTQAAHDAMGDGVSLSGLTA